MKKNGPLLKLLAMLAVTTAPYSLRWVEWRVTWSGSVARGLYRVVDRPLERGDLVILCLPRELGEWAKGRGYLSAGECPGGVAAIGKPVVGLSGDRVTVLPEYIATNGHPLERSQRAWLDSAGRPMPWARIAQRALEPGQLWLHSAHSAKSLDSRIFGPLPIDAVREVLVPVLVEAP